MDFPTAPTVGTTVNNGISTWTWNGQQWNTGSQLPIPPAAVYVPPNGGNIIFQFP